MLNKLLYIAATLSVFGTTLWIVAAWLFIKAAYTRYKGTKRFYKITINIIAITLLVIAICSIAFCEFMSKATDMNYIIGGTILHHDFAKSMEWVNLGLLSVLVLLVIRVSWIIGVKLEVVYAKYDRRKN